jgi:uncharacterized protein YdhG (YjbR/CyaY superfamily)
MAKFESIQAYWDAFDGSVVDKMTELQHIITQVAPLAEPCISYNMPAFKQSKIIAYYAGYKNHLGFYPLPACIVHFQNELTTYKTSKGAVQFPLNQPLPADLIARMIRFNLDNIS